MKLFKNKIEDKILRCPRCNKAMDKATRQEVTIDVCPKCHGIWLDDNEIEKVVAFGKKKSK